MVDLANCTLVAFSDQLLLIGFQDLGFTCVYIYICNIYLYIYIHMFYVRTCSISIIILYLSKI